MYIYKIFLEFYCTLKFYFKFNKKIIPFKVKILNKIISNIKKLQNNKSILYYK